jgi:hypothetical protein
MRYFVVSNSPSETQSYRIISKDFYMNNGNWWNRKIGKRIKKWKKQGLRKLQKRW